MGDKTKVIEDRLIKVPQWYSWSESRLRLEDAKFALRCAESMRDRLTAHAGPSKHKEVP